MKSEPEAASRATIRPPVATSRRSWPGRLLRICVVLILVLIASVFALPYALPWILQQQGIDFHWQNPQWRRTGFSVSQLQLTLPGDGANPKTLQLENLHIDWAWKVFPIQHLQADRVQMNWPVTDEQTSTDRAIQALPAVLLKWLPQHIELPHIDANLSGVGHLQGSLTLSANAQGQLWQPAFVHSELTLKNPHGTWLDSIPVELRPKQLSAQINTHPDHQDNDRGQQVLTVDVRSEGPALAHSTVRTEQLHAHGTITVHADADRFSVSVNEHSSLEAKKLQSSEIGYVEKASLQLAGLSVQGRTSPPYEIQVHGPFSAHLEGLGAEQLRTQDWDVNGTVNGQFPLLEMTGTFAGQHGLSLDGEMRLLGNALQGSVTLNEITFKADNPLKKTFKDWPEQISLNSGRLRSKIDFSLPDTGQLALSVKGSASGLSGFIDKGEFKNLGLELSGELDLQDAAAWQGTVKDGQISVQLDSLAHPGLHAEQLRAHALFAAQSDSGQFTVSFNQDATLETSTLLLPGIGTAQKLILKLPDLKIQGRNRAPHEITAHSPISAHIEQLNGEQLHTQSWDFTGSLDGQVPQLELTGRLVGQHGLSLASRIRLQDNTLQGNATMSEIFFKAGNPLQKTFKLWPELMAFNSGQLNGKIDFTLPKTGSLKLSLNGSATGLNGIVNRSELKSLDVQFNGQLAGKALKLNIPSLAIAQLDPGIPLGSIQLTNAHYRATFNHLLRGTADWQSASANLLKGRIWTDAQQLDLNRADTLLLNVEGLELQELFRLYPADGLAGTGIIDGQLPIFIDHGVFHVDAGTLQARQPGVLQFHSEKIQALGDSNPTMRIVADALDDFHFNVLRSMLSYTESGKLLLNIRLEGQNPDVEKGRPIHLNINLEEDIPALLASIQLSGQVSEIIQKRVRERLEKR